LIIIFFSFYYIFSLSRDGGRSLPAHGGASEGSPLDHSLAQPLYVQYPWEGPNRRLLIYVQLGISLSKTYLYPHVLPWLDRLGMPMEDNVMRPCNVAIL